MLVSAARPLILIGPRQPRRRGLGARVALAEALGAAVLTDLKVGAAFPTEHPLHAAAPGTFLTDAGRELLPLRTSCSASTGSTSAAASNRPTAQSR